MLEIRIGCRETGKLYRYRGSCAKRGQTDIKHGAEKIEAAEAVEDTYKEIFAQVRCRANETDQGRAAKCTSKEREDEGKRVMQRGKFSVGVGVDVESDGGRRACGMGRGSPPDVRYGRRFLGLVCCRPGVLTPLLVRAAMAQVYSRFWMDARTLPVLHSAFLNPDRKGCTRGLILVFLLVSLCCQKVLFLCHV